MKTLVVGLFTIAGALFTVQTTGAISPDIVIAQVQAGSPSGNGAATQEFLTLYNNSAVSVDITGWCLKSNSGNVACFEPAALNETVYLASQSYALVASEAFMSVYPESVSPEVSYDAVFPVRNASSGSLVGSSDTVRLINKNGDEVDTAGWTSTLSGGQTLTRKTVTTGLLLDTDQASDFTKTTFLTIPQSGVHYVQTAVDLCTDLVGIQEVLPEQYGYDEAGNCELLSADLCQNIPNIQLVYPEGMLANDDSVCLPDVCENIPGLQVTLPAFHIAEEANCIKMDDRVLLVTELLANASGSDIGREFIEIYNPNNSSVLLKGYVLQIGKLFEKSFDLGRVINTAAIGPYEYLAVYDSQLGFTLLNTTGGVRVVAPAGNIVSGVVYEEPGDDVSWSLFGTDWAYTNQPTPGAANLQSLVEYDEEVLSASTAPAPCGSGKYRHPITNRCRNIENDATMLVSCDNDEYRNPETNRCRKIATLATSLTPCAQGYERNSETNRCRKVEDAAAALSPCQTGYERNPDTNRCRKALLAAADTSKSSEAAVQQASNNTLTNALVITAGLSAAGYGLYEWRSELFRGLRRLIQFTSGK